MPPTSTFAAALTGQEAIELKRWIIGPERGSKGRRRGLAARLADVASYDEAGGEAIDRRMRSGRRRCPPKAGCSGSPTAMPSGAIETLLAAVRAITYARDESGGQEAGYGIETEAAQLDGEFRRSWRSRPPRRWARSAVRCIKLGVRLEAMIEDAPDWLDAQGRARIEGARHSLAWRVDTAGRVGSAARPARRPGRSRISSTGWRSTAPTRANSTSASTAASSIR